MKKISNFVLLIFLLLALSNVGYASQGENQVKSFVYKWFSLFDRNADTEDFLVYLPKSGFKMAFPEATLRNHDDFKSWYKGIQATIKSANHELKQLEVQRIKNAFKVKLLVLWRAQTFAGKSLSFDAFQTWNLSFSSKGIPQINEYVVSDGKGYRNRTKIKIANLDEPAFGGFVTIAEPKVIENLALPGKLDFVWLEAEHSEFGAKEVQLLAAFAENEGLTPVVRVPDNDFNLIKKYIGTGIQGIVVPSIKTAEDAENAVNAIKYPPIGKRAAGAERSNRYLGRFAEYKERANHEMLAIIMIETKESVENIEEILKVPGIDLIHMGPYDLSLSLSVDMKSEKLAMAIKRVELAAKRYGIPLGCYAPNMEVAKEKVVNGYRFFTIPGDMELLQNGTRQFFAE